MKYLNQAFTLIELMVTIAIPAYVDYVARAQMAKAFAIATGLKSPVVEHYSSYGVCPESGRNSTSKGGFADTSSYAGKYVNGARVGLDLGNYCSIWVRMGSTVKHCLSLLAW